MADEANPNANFTLDLSDAISVLENALAKLRSLDGLSVEQSPVDVPQGGRNRRNARAEISRDLQWTTSMCDLASAEIWMTFWAFRGKDDPREH